jgi:hypothetical protein
MPSVPFVSALQLFSLSGFLSRSIDLLQSRLISQSRSVAWSFAPQSNSSSTLGVILGCVVAVVSATGLTIAILIFRRCKILPESHPARSEYSPDEEDGFATVTTIHNVMSLDLAATRVSLFDAASLSDGDDSLG